MKRAKSRHHVVSVSKQNVGGRIHGPVPNRGFISKAKDRYAMPVHGPYIIITFIRNSSFSPYPLAALDLFC